MKKMILVVLMVVMIATPCIAQIDMSTISIENTLWQKSDDSDYQIGFANGKTYCGDEEAPGRYIDRPLLGIVALQCEGILVGLLSPYLGSGIAYYIDLGSSIAYSIGIGDGALRETWNLKIIDDNWTPPSD